MKYLLIILLLTGCVVQRPTALTVKFHKNGYTYAIDGYATYRAKLDTFIERGTRITVLPSSKDTIGVFKRVR